MIKKEVTHEYLTEAIAKLSGDKFQLTNNEIRGIHRAMDHVNDRTTAHSFRMTDEFPA